jgi:hypothetical protein
MCRYGRDIMIRSAVLESVRLVVEPNGIVTIVKSVDKMRYPRLHRDRTSPVQSIHDILDLLLLDLLKVRPIGNILNLSDDLPRKFFIWLYGKMPSLFDHPAMVFKRIASHEGRTRQLFASFTTSVVGSVWTLGGRDKL